MFKGLFRLSMLLVTGKFLKPRIKGLLVLLGFWLLLWFLQSEYLNYVDYSGDSSYVLQSTIIKVSLILLSLIIYVFAIERPLMKKMPSLSNQVNTPAVRSESVKKGRDRSLEKFSTADDGFEFLRHKKKLKSVSEQLLEKD